MDKKSLKKKGIAIASIIIIISFVYAINVQPSVFGNSFDWFFRHYFDNGSSSDLKTFSSYDEFIDYLQNIQASWSDYEKHSKIAREIQRVAIKTGKTIFWLSQLSNSTWRDVNNWSWDFVSMKWSWEYTTNSDVIFVLRKSEIDWQIQMKIQKNKFWKNWDEFEFKVDYRRNQFELLWNVSVVF